MKKLMLLTLLLLTSCATHDQFQPYTDHRERDWADCFNEAYHDYQGNRDQTGRIAGGILFGPIGALVGDSLSNSEADDAAKKKSTDFQPYIKECMAKKGYTKIN